jgi:lipoprotein-anchoring transpeptidase ErfK/SrfK
LKRRTLVTLLAIFALSAAAVSALGFSLRTFGPQSSWNVFSAAPTATPTPTATATATPTPTPTFTATATSTATPTPTATPEPYVPAANPPAVPGPEVQGERWVDVDLERQTATAMVGDQALYTALVTTGKPGWQTPKGTFQILYRVADETMTSVAIGAEEYYVLKHVLYTQYFTNQGHALHLNYWRENYYFGRIASSHGCVGMRLADAKFFWDFVGVGSRVTIH